MLFNFRYSLFHLFAFTTVAAIIFANELQGRSKLNVFSGMYALIVIAVLRNRPFLRYIVLAYATVSVLAALVLNRFGPFGLGESLMGQTCLWVGCALAFWPLTVLSSSCDYLHDAIIYPCDLPVLDPLVVATFWFGVVIIVGLLPAIQITVAKAKVLFRKK